MALFTGKGDDGTTYLFDTPKGERIPKTSAIIEALGTLDELNSYLGVCKAGARSSTLKNIVESLQESLFIIQAELAGSDKHIDPEKVNELEDIIYAIEQRLPPITTFLIPGETLLSAHFDVARTLARKAERRIVGVGETSVRNIGVGTMAYLNRLSSVLYALARYSAHEKGKKEHAPHY